MRRVLGAVLFICGAWLAEAACDSSRDTHAADAGQRDAAVRDAGTPGPRSLAQRAACAQLAAAQCADASNCEAMQDADVDAGSSSNTCLAIEQARCEAIFGLPGVRLDPAGPLQMAEAIRRRGCLEKWAVDGEWRGSLELDTGCVRDEQCNSGVCVTVGDNCGKCKLLLAAARAPGESCGDSERGRLRCQANAFCIRADPANYQIGTCYSRDSVGSSCHEDLANSCVGDDLICVMGACSKRLARDESCDPAHDSCDSGLKCDSTSKRCRSGTPQNLELGATCPRYLATALCKEGLYCELPDGVDLRFYDGPGTCRAYAYVHEPCGEHHNCYNELACSGGVCEPAPSVMLGRRDPSSAACQQ